MMTWPRLRLMLVPLLVLIAINLVAALLRTMPAIDSASVADEVWPEFVLPAAPVAVHEKLLAGGQWGVRAVSEIIGQKGQENAASPTLTEVQVVHDYIRQQLQGIVYRSGWYVLFAPQGDDTLPLELQEGDTLPNSSWMVSRILQDRLEILDTEAADAEPLVVPLYSTPDASTEP